MLKTQLIFFVIAYAAAIMLVFLAARQKLRMGSFIEENKTAFSFMILLLPFILFGPGLFRALQLPEGNLWMQILVFIVAALAINILAYRLIR